MAGDDFLSRSLLVRDLITEQKAGAYWYVDGRAKTEVRTGKSFSAAFATIGAALDAASAYDVILVEAGDYDETVTITKDNITIIGVGARTSVSVAPTTANANAVVIDGTTAAGRIEEVTLININGDADGTGIGLYAKGNIRRIRVHECKFEAADTTGTAIKLESTVAGSIGDVLLDDTEVCWAATGLSLEVSGGGDPQTEVFIQDCRFHNLVANHIINATASTASFELRDTTFANLEAGTAPTGLYVDLRAGTSTGLIAGCYFPAAVNGGKVLVDAGVSVVGCYFTGGINTTAPT